jgi:hypothetical protein
VDVTANCEVWMVSDEIEKKWNKKIRGKKREKRGAVECTEQKYVQWCNDRSRRDKF